MRKIPLLFALFLAFFPAFSQEKSVSPLTASSMAALSGIGERTLSVSLPGHGEAVLKWSERASSFSRSEGIRTFAGYGDAGLSGILSLRGERLSGWLLHEGRTWRVAAASDGGLVLSPGENEAACGACAALGETPAPGFVKSSAPQPRSASWSDAVSDSIVWNDGVLRVYRLAIPVDYYYFSGSYFGGSVDRVKAFWAETEAGLNELYVRDLGICFQVVDDDRLIFTSPDVLFHNSTNGSTIIGLNTLRLDERIGSEAYDLGIAVARVTSGETGRASLFGAYKKYRKGAAVGGLSLGTLAHEIGHLFGAEHTHVNRVEFSSHTEPGDGQSVMSYGFPRDFFALHSIYVIRRELVKYVPYYAYPGREELVRPELAGNERGHDNFAAGIATGNRPPVIDTTRLQRRYRIPKQTYFQFTIPASDPDGDSLRYAAHQTDFSELPAGENATFLTRAATDSPVVGFQPAWTYSWSQGKFVEEEYSDPTATGTFRFWLSASDGRAAADILSRPHAASYDAYETQVEIVEGTPFRFTSRFGYEYAAGQRLVLTWNVDRALFPEGSRVRVLLSDDFGKTFKHVLKPSVPNDGRCEVILPQMAFSSVPYGASGTSVRPGVVKIEAIGGIAYALSAVSPVFDNGEIQSPSGGFRLTASPIEFSGMPERFLAVSEADIPPVADVTAASGGMPLEVVFSETREGSVISRVWEAENAQGVRSAFEQIICVTENEPPFVAVERVALDAQELSLAVGATWQLVAEVLPTDATDPALSWSSDDEAVCSVGPGGLVTATGIGSATVTAAAAGGAVAAACAVTVSATTGAASAARAAWSAKAGKGCLLLENAAGERAEIFNLQGIRLHSRRCGAATECFAVEPGVYVVRAGAGVARVAVP